MYVIRGGMNTNIVILGEIHYLLYFFYTNHCMPHTKFEFRYRDGNLPNTFEHFYVNIESCRELTSQSFKD